MVRAAAATMFFGKTADDLVDGGDELTDDVAETLREWAGHARERGVAAIFEAAQRSGMGDRVLSWQGGERQMTDLAHMTQLLQEAAHREHFSLPALRDWLRAQRDEGAAAGTIPAPGQRRCRRSGHDGLRRQGSAVSRRVPAVRVQPQCLGRRAAGVPRGRAAVPVHRGKRRPRTSTPLPGRRGRGSQRRQPADLCRDDARAVAGGRVVGAVEGRTQRRAVAAAAGTPPGRGRGAGSCFAGEDLGRRRDGALHGVGGGGRPRHRGVGGGGRCLRCRPRRRARTWRRGTSIVRSTPRGGGRRTPG